MEYFAECSNALFSRNNSFPFTRDIAGKSAHAGCDGSRQTFYAGRMPNATRISPIGPVVAAVALRLPRPRRAGVRPDERVRASVAPLCAALLVAARRVPPSIRVEIKFLVALGKDASAPRINSAFQSGERSQNDPSDRIRQWSERCRNCVGIHVDASRFNPGLPFPTAMRNCDTSRGPLT